MLHTRCSVHRDIPAQRELWKLAFGDSGPYVDNFYTTYYRPERVLVLEEDGVVRAMTAWFDTTLVLPGQGAYRCAYLYAVATHPDCRGRGLAAKLLADADEYFTACGIPAVSTVPAQPSLHKFFGQNGFRECFTLAQGELLPEQLPTGQKYPLNPVTPLEYGQLREQLLSHLPHIAYPQDALAYQAGCCSLSGGGLFRGDTPAGPVCLCAEGAGEGLVVVKEYLGAPAAQRMALPGLAAAVPAQRWQVRGVLNAVETGASGWEFAMLKWLDGQLEQRWDWSQSAYLGLAFD